MKKIIVLIISVFLLMVTVTYAVENVGDGQGLKGPEDIHPLQLLYPENYSEKQDSILVDKDAVFHPTPKYILGEVLRDKITGFSGVVMGITLYYTGCIHYGLCSQELSYGKPLEWQWFDESRIIREHKIMFEMQETPTSGEFQNPPEMN